MNKQQMFQDVYGNTASAESIGNSKSLGPGLCFATIFACVQKILVGTGFARHHNQFST